MQIEYIVTMADGRKMCHVLPFNKAYEFFGDEVSIEVSAIYGG